MVVITQKRFEGQDGKPTNPKLLKLMNEGVELKDIPHQYFFPENVLKNLINVKKTVLKNKEAYIKSGGGNKMTSAVLIVDGYSASGKTLTEGSKVLMSNGEWKNIEDVKIGDEVISPQNDGSHTFEKVTHLHNRFEEEIYEVWEKNRQKRFLYSCAGNHEIVYLNVEKKEIRNIEARDLAKLKIPIYSLTMPNIRLNIKKGKKNTDIKRIKIELKKGKPSQVYGFSITGESKWHITDNFMVTHNSTIASQIGLFFDPTMTLEKNYAWNMQKLMRLIEHPSPGQVIILDEGMIFNSRKANSQDNIKLIVALSQVRSKGVFFIICINSVHQLEKSIPLSRADFLVHVKRIGGMTGTPKYCIYDSDKMKQLIVKNAGKYSYAGVYPNVDWMTFSRYMPFNDVRYDKMKHKESLKNIDDNKKKEKDIKVKLGLARLVEFLKQEYDLSYKKSSKIIKMPLTSIDNYRILLKEQKENQV